MPDYIRTTYPSGEVVLKDVLTLLSFKAVDSSRFYQQFLVRVAEGAVVEDVTISSPGPTVIYHVASKIFDGDKLVVTTDWVELGGAVANPHFFCSKPGQGFIRTVFAYSTTNGAGEIKLVETHGNVSRDLVTTPVPLLSTDGVTTDFYFDSNVVPLNAGDNIYSVYARLTTATDIMLKYMNSAVMELVIPS